jgi:hypothetical protein
MIPQLSFLKKLKKKIKAKELLDVAIMFLRDDF